MEKTVMKVKQLQIKAFTLLESLLTLLITSFVLLVLSGSVQSAFEQVQNQLFFLEFEHFYQETQKLSVASQSRLDLQISQTGISNGISRLPVPKSVQLAKDVLLHFDQAGGNSSLSKIVFKTREQTVTYQLSIGNGKIKKTTN